MKYIKSISLFFVYPLCCFVLGVFTGNITKVNDEKELIRMEESIVSQEVVEEVPETVMNNHALAQISVTTLETEARQEGYYITIHEEYVMVYASDKTTLFLATNIRAQDLPADLKEELEAGMYVEDEGELYGFLENYTS